MVVIICKSYAIRLFYLKIEEEKIHSRSAVYRDARQTAFKTSTHVIMFT